MHGTVLRKEEDGGGDDFTDATVERTNIWKQCFGVYTAHIFVIVSSNCRKICKISF